MSQPARFYIDGFLLNISESAYLVRVEPANGDTALYAQAASLPGWIFNSAHAIWLTQENAPLLERARRGDEVKNRILNRGGTHAKQQPHDQSRRFNQRPVRRSLKADGKQNASNETRLSDVDRHATHFEAISLAGRRM